MLDLDPDSPADILTDLIDPVSDILDYREMLTGSNRVFLVLLKALFYISEHSHKREAEIAFEMLQRLRSSAAL